MAASLPRSLPRLTWPDPWLRQRDRLLANPQFQRWAGRFPLTRWLARRRARELFDICAGFVYSQVLYACVRLDLFETLAPGPLELDRLAERLDMPRAGAERLVRAAVSLRLLETRGAGRFGLGPLGAAMRANPGIAAMVQHHALLYGDLADPISLLRGEPGNTALSRYWPYAEAETPHGLQGEDVAAYSDLMGASQPWMASEVLDAYPLGRHRCLLDVGGGDGTFLATVAQRHPNLALMLFDLPAVTERARRRFEADGLKQQVMIHGGDVFIDPLPTGADLISLVRILHDHDTPRVRRILHAVRAALPPDGQVLIAEPMAGTPGAEPVGDAYFGWYLWAMGGGQPRRPDELSALLRETGFRDIRLVGTRTPLLTRIMLARPTATRSPNMK